MDVPSGSCLEFRVIRGWLSILCALAAMTADAKASTNEDGSAQAGVSAYDNAALDYWKACALMQEILSDEVFDIVLFSEKQLRFLPPKVFAYRPKAGRWLLNERKMLEALHEGAAKPHCVYARPGPGRAAEGKIFRSAMRSLVNRALSSAKAQEFVGEHRVTASIYVDVVRLLRHLDQDEEWISAYYTINMLPLLLWEVEGFLSRAPPREAVQVLIGELSSMKRPRFPMRRMLIREAISYSTWLMESPEQVEAKISSLYQGENLKPALDPLLSVDLIEKIRIVQEWVDGYRNTMSRLGAAMGLPYTEAIQVIRKIDGQVAGAINKYAKAATNPLMPLLMPPMSKTYEQFLLAEAGFVLMELMCKAAAYNDFVRSWPDTIEILEQFSGSPLPPNPFTGKAIDYDLRGERPRARIDSPKWLKGGNMVTEMNLRYRVETDAEQLATVIRDLQRQAKMEQAVTESRQEERSKRDTQSKPARSRVGRGLFR